MSAIQDKVVVVTDDTGDRAMAIVRHLVARGAIVVVAARRIDRLEALVSELARTGGRAKAVAADVAHCEQVEALVAGTIGAYGRVDVLINNAGPTEASLSRSNADEWDRMIDVHIKGLLYGIAAALPAFKRQGDGHVINIASASAGAMFSSDRAIYAGMLCAVRAISERLRHEAGGAFRTTTISAGALNSPLAGVPDRARARLVDNLYKLAIPADLVARAIAFAIEQPADGDVNEIVLQPTAQSQRCFGSLASAA